MSGDAGANGQMAMPPPCEIITLTNAGVNVMRVPGNPQAMILAFTLPNGRQYQVPLDADGRKAVIKELGGVQVFGPGDIPG
jgi:hypothetical protein